MSARCLFPKAFKQLAWTDWSHRVLTPYPDPTRVCALFSQASHVVNKVASNAKKEEQKAAAEAVAAKGHSLEIGDDHKATVHLPG